MLIKKFEEQVEQFKNNTAVKVGTKTLTFEQLNCEANRVAAEIAAQTAGRGSSQAALLFEHGADMITGMVAALKADMLYIPLDRRYPENRLSYMLEDSQASVILTNETNLPLAQRIVAAVGGEKKIKIIEIGNTAAGRSETNPQREGSGRKPAYILYTSGSTGKPKGVLQNRENVLYYVRNWIERFSITPKDRMTFLTAFTHDGAQQDIWSALLSGATLYPYDVKNVLGEVSLSEFVEKEEITIWHSVPTLFRYFVENLTPGTPFPFLRTILLGGEPLRQHDLELLKQYFPQTLLANVYGQTESSVGTIKNYTAEDTFDMPILGEPLDETGILLVDADGEVVEDVGSGEIVIACDYIAEGYWRDAEKTEANFTDDPDMGKLYWTGDLGRLKGNGEIAIIGRKDFQLKIQGFRVEVGEIETALLRHDAVKEALITVNKTSDKGAPYLCAYITPNHHVQTEDLRDYLLALLPDYMIPAVFIQMEKFPLTPNGKIDRKAFPDPELERMKKEISVPVSEVEKTLAGIWSEELGMPLETIGRESDFFEMGGQSLKAFVIIEKVHKEMNARLEIEDIFSFPRLDTLAGQIGKRSGSAAYKSVPIAEEKEYYPLSSAQERLFILQELEPDSIGYNLSDIVEWPGRPDKEQLEKTVKQLIARHESFRTTFHTVKGKPVQRIHKKVEFSIRYHGKEEKENLLKGFRRPFDLSQAPLLRLEVISLEEETHLLLLDMHHIIIDGLSEQIFIREFRQIYEGKELPQPALRYRDYSQWQQDPGRIKELEKQQEYWLEQMAGELPVLDLPADNKRPPVQQFDGGKVRFSLTPEETRQLRDLAAGEDVTIYMLMLATVNLLFSKLSGKEDILLGTPTAGRRHADLQGVVGMLVNTLVIRSKPETGKTFNGFLQEVKQQVLSAFENQDFQFEELVEKVSPNRDLSRNPIFDAMFVLHSKENETGSGSEAQGETVVEHREAGRSDSYQFETGVSYFDLTIHTIERGDTLAFSWHYSSALFKKETIERFISNFKAAVAALLKKPGALICEIDILGEEERKQLLFDFNDTAGEYPQDKTLHELFEEQVIRTPDQIAVVGPSIMEEQNNQPAKGDVKGVDGKSGGKRHRLTFRELYEKVERWAGVLIRKGAQADTIVGIMVERSVEMIAAILAILRAGGAYLPIDPEYPQERVNYMLSDSKTKLVVTQNNLLSKLKEENRAIDIKEELDVIDLETIDTIVPDSGTGEKNDHGHKKESAGDASLAAKPVSSLAYLIYTSGSTGRPKGVMLEHRSVANLLKGITNVIQFTGDDSILCLTTICFDIFVLEVFAPLTTGSKLVVVSSDEQIDAEAAALLMKEEKITILQLTPSRLSLFLAEQASAAALKNIKSLLVGGEAFPEILLARAREKVGGKIYNGYGPTETTIYSTIKDVSVGESLNIGKPLLNTQVYILGKNDALQPLGVAGELCIAGDGLARGYLKRPELTAEKFVNNPLSLSFPNNQSPITNNHLYRTGDLARWLPDGNIEFIGRLDFQVKIRGFRVETGEIETLLEKHDAIKEAVVIAKGNDGEKYLCAYIVTGETEAESAAAGIDKSALAEYLSVTLPDYMIPGYFVPMEKLPLTPNGKLNKKALPEPEVVIDTETFAASSNELEQRLAALWSQVLGIDKEKLSVTDSFFHLGGHSLKVIQLAALIHKEFHIKIPLQGIFKAPFIRGIAHYLQEAAVEQFAKIERAEPAASYPLSSAQKRLYLLQQMETESTVYNITQVLPLEALYAGETEDTGLDKTKLERTIRQLIARHESFRTSFFMKEEEPRQEIHNRVPFEIEYYREAPAEVILKEFIRPFELSCAPLLRVGVIERKDAGPLLLTDMHHIISDGQSLEIVARDFAALYREQPLAELELQYKDFAIWQNSAKIKETTLKQEAYWLNILEDEIPVLNLPLDYPRPAVQEFDGGQIRFPISQKETAALKQLARERGTTLYMVLLAVTTILMSRLGAREDIILGTPVAGRTHADLENIIGMFVNTLPLRNRPNAEKTFAAYLEEVKINTLEAFENQDYQFEDLVEAAAVKRDAARNPVFDVMFSMNAAEAQQGDTAREEMEKDEPEMFESEDRDSKFDLTLDVVSGEKLMITFEYCLKLFKKQTIHRFAGYFKNIIAGILSNPESKLMEIEMLPEEEKKQLLLDFNDITTGFPQDKTLQQLFEEQAERTPANIALIDYKEGDYKEGNRRELNYRGLNEKAGNLASRLIEKGVVPGTIAGIKTHRSMEMIIAILAVLKAGGAYVPIDPAYPEERTRYIIKDSSMSVLLTTRILAETTSFDKEVVYLDEAIWGSEKSGKSEKRQTTEPVIEQSASDPAYIIYTSGTTGRPKGVIVEHRNVAAYLEAFYKEINIKARHTILQQSTFTFDVFVEEMFAMLLRGGSIAIPTREMVPDIEKLTRFIKENEVNIIDCSPLLLNRLNEVGAPAGLEIFISGGDVLKEEYIDRLLETGPVFNIYGPTETTIGATLYRCSQDEPIPANIPIGKPMANYNVYILDKNGNLSPRGVPGELCIDGPGVAKGYLNKPELTAERFTEAGSTFPNNQSPITNNCLYRTGDLARWLPDGNIEFMGRIDFQVKVRGFRIEIGEIESQLLKHPAIKEAVVLVRETDGDKYLCAYYVTGTGTAETAKTAEIRRHLSETLPDYMIPAFFVPLDSIPLTTSGKPDRKALPEPGIDKTAKGTVPRNSIEKKLAAIWNDVLGKKEEHASVNIDANFFEIGGHSLKATVMISKIHKALEVKIPLTEIFKTSTIRGLAKYILTAKEEKYTAIEPVAEQEYYELSSAQERLFIIQQMETQSIAYNMPAILQVEGELNLRQLEKAFRGLVERHESLRTSFKTVDGKPVQQIHKDVPFEIEHYEKAAPNVEPSGPWTEEGSQNDQLTRVQQEFIRPFELSRAPLLRVGLVKKNPRQQILMVDIHHIVTDGTSMGLLVKEFMALYAGEQLAPLNMRYRDYAHWRKQRLNRELMESREHYWLNVFSGELPKLQLPLDHPRPPIREYKGEIYDIQLPGEETAALKALAAKESVSLYMMISAVFNILLAKLSGQEDIIVGTPVAGRDHDDLQHVIGMFVHTLALRNYPEGEKTFHGFLQELKENTLKSFENQEYPFENLVDKLGIQRDAARNPLFDVMLLLENFDVGGGEIPGLKLTPVGSDSHVSKFDLTLTAMESNDHISFRLEYASHLFEQETIRRFANYLRKIIAGVHAKPGERIAALDILDKEERNRILYEFNDTTTDYPRDKTLHEIFEQQVEKNPDKIALVDSARNTSGIHTIRSFTSFQSLTSTHKTSPQEPQPRHATAVTYRELNEKSNRLARYLQGKGVAPGTIVAIIAERSI
ncbi:MAG: amino acid adenylation domain-containing protein, partial [bacterium]|nr:amino acid adenylation domain-containing protein [bacterium]